MDKKKVELLVKKIEEAAEDNDLNIGTVKYLLGEAAETLDELWLDHQYLMEVRDPGGCQCADDEACQFARDRDKYKDLLERAQRLLSVCEFDAPEDLEDYDLIFDE